MMHGKSNHTVNRSTVNRGITVLNKYPFRYIGGLYPHIIGSRLILKLHTRHTHLFIRVASGKLNEEEY